MLSLHSWFTTVVNGCLSAIFGTEYSSSCVLCGGCRQVMRRAINIALGQYWFLLLLHGFIPPGPGQYGVLLPWLEEVMTQYIMSVLYPPIQEEMRILGNIA